MNQRNDGAESRGRTRRYEYHMVEYGELTYHSDPEYKDLETAIRDMAGSGWRFVQALEDPYLAIFEREVNHD